MLTDGKNITTGRSRRWKTLSEHIYWLARLGFRI